MAASDNKEIIQKYFAAVSGGDFDTVVATFADDVVWWVPPASPMAGTYEGKQAVLEMFGKGTELYAQEPMKIDVQTLTAEDDRVAAEVVITATTAKGAEYRNHYHFLFTLAGGQVKSVHEHVDTLYAQQTLFS